MPDDYVRTRVTRLKVSGYRSLYDVELDDLPDIVVFHGKNGTGKSNLMGVAGMVLRWVGTGDFLPRIENEFRGSYRTMDDVLGLRPTDFSRGRSPELRIQLELMLGTAAGQIVNRTSDPPGPLRIEVSAEDTGSAIRFWFDEASVGDFDLLQSPNPHTPALFHRIREAFTTQALLLHYPAYRSITREVATDASMTFGASSFQKRMFAVHIDSDIKRRRQLKRLGQRLGELGTFATEGDVELSPVLDSEYGEHRLFVSAPGIGDVPLENLGTGQQQLIMMAADALVERRPIVQLEEPEAHLHAELMTSFAEFLRLEAETAEPESPIDQVWISTHHHAFAIAPQYFEVTHDVEGGTKVERRDRAEAAPHFYEPGPLWEALRSLANSTSRETVVMHDAEGHPVTAGEILDSIAGDRQRANEFAEAATRAIVSRFRKQPVHRRAS